MDETEAKLIVDTGRRSCPRCHGTGIYRWGVVHDGVPEYAGTCFKCNGDKRIPASKRIVMEAERVLGLRPPVKPRTRKPPAESEPFDWSACPVPF